jgi:hypothetical protein
MKLARPVLLRVLIADIARSRAARLIIERDESLIAVDRRTSREALVKNNYIDKLTYEHTVPSDHATLWVSDAVAWCYQAGGDWLRRARPLVVGVTRLNDKD